MRDGHFIGQNATSFDGKLSLLGAGGAIWHAKDEG